MTPDQRLEGLLTRISSACKRSGRDPSSVTLVAVSKTHPPASVQELARLGILDFGESKVQEAKAKIPECPGHLRWHGIGHLQTNKVRDAVHLFSMIHSVDSLRLAQEISKQATAQSKHLRILLEVNVSGEGSKFGLKPEEVATVAIEVNKLSHLELQGLMTMAPYTEEVETTRPYFRKLAEIKQEVEQKWGAPLPHLSMGMSSDFEIAIEEGATLVRLGTALFGERKGSAYRNPIPPDL